MVTAGVESETEGLQTLRGEPQLLITGPQPAKRHWGVSAIIGLAVLGLLNGCAIHYYDQANGTEHLWGLGRVSWNKHPETNDWVTVRTGLVSPGLVIGVGPSFTGIALGNTARESMRVASVTEAAEMRATINGVEISSATRGRWNLGHISLSAPAGCKRVLVTGKALAGIKMALEEGRPSLTGGLSTQQKTEMEDQNAMFTMEQATTPWPHLQFFDATIHFTTNCLPEPSSIR